MGMYNHPPNPYMIVGNLYRARPHQSLLVGCILRRKVKTYLFRFFKLIFARLIFADFLGIRKNLCPPIFFHPTKINFVKINLVLNICL